MTFRGVFLVLAFIGLNSAMAASTPADIRPEFVPQGWVADYDYESNIHSYLERQSKLARAENKSAYVYFYTDESSTHCEGIRKLTRGRAVGEAFASVRMVLLNFEFFSRQLYEEDPSRPHLGRYAPVIMKIGGDGVLTGPILHPDAYINHVEMIPDYQYRVLAKRSRHNKPFLINQFAKRLNDYFLEDGVELTEEKPASLLVIDETLYKKENVFRRQKTH